jgi:catechol 2,3-dioxygenase-like lactoylglutathione lyase family enzyme
MTSPVRTYGLTHIALIVRDGARASKFYKDVFGAVEVYNQDGFIQLQTPGTRDVIVLEEKSGAGASPAGMSGGIAHFGFRLRRPKDIHAAVQAVTAAGGTILGQGEFVPGEPYLFARDPDGYELEIWYELPTSVDPPARRRKPRAGKGLPRRSGPVLGPRRRARRTARRRSGR